MLELTVWAVNQLTLKLYLCKFYLFKLNLCTVLIQIFPVKFSLSFYHISVIESFEFLIIIMPKIAVIGAGKKLL